MRKVTTVKVFSTIVTEVDMEINRLKADGYEVIEEFTYPDGAYVEMKKKEEV